MSTCIVCGGPTRNGRSIDSGAEAARQVPANPLVKALTAYFEGEHSVAEQTLWEDVKVAYFRLLAGDKAEAPRHE